MSVNSTRLMQISTTPDGPPTRRRAGALAGLAALAALALGACATDEFTEGRVIWETAFDAVTIVPQDSAGAPPPPNTHPIQVSAEDMRLILASLRARYSGREALINLDMFFGDEEAFAPVFLDEEMSKLAGPLAQALGAAGPTEDVAFQVTGYRGDGPLEFLTEEITVTTGRVFHRDGRLNIIFGELQESMSDRAQPQDHPRGVYVSDIDRALVRLDPGSRSQESNIAWQILPKPGLFFASYDGDPRRDWLVIDPGPLLMAARAGPQAVPQSTGPAVAPEQLETIRRQMDMENRELRQRIDELEQLMRNGPNATAAPAAPAVAAPAVAVPSAPSAEVEERLARLKAIYDRGLIDEQLYQERAQELLDGS